MYVRVYGGKANQDINLRKCHTVTKLKMISLYDFMPKSFKHKGHCDVMDSAYMGDTMCQVGREVWGITMVGTCQSDRTGACALEKADIKAKEIVIGSNESLMYQHNTKPLERKKEINKPREEIGNKVMLIALDNKKTTALLIIQSIKEMKLKISMIYQLSCIYMDGPPS